MNKISQWDNAYSTVLDGVKGKVIEQISFTDDCYQFDGGSITVRFTNGSGLMIGDNGQSCCEYRYMSCDDDLPSYVGETVTNVEVSDGPCEQSVDCYGDCHETQFLRIHTTGGTIVCVNHNEHNGYYGGFSLALRVLNNA